jgi:hypothetical protein
MCQLSGYNYHLNLNPEGKNVERSIVLSDTNDILHKNGNTRQACEG